MCEGLSQYDLLIKNNWIIPTDKGCYILNEDFLLLMNLFDSVLLRWAKEDDAVTYMYPDFMPIDKLSECKYIEQFHNHCFFSSTSEYDDYDSNKLTLANYINNPSVCMHCYIQHEGEIVDINKPIAITAKGKCKRKEDKYKSLDRLMDFTMREVVFIGSEDFVLKKRSRYMELCKNLMEELALEGNIKASNDPFFKKTDSNKSVFQQKFKLKYELNFMDKDEKREVAVGSFNFHGIHFGRAFHITSLDNKYIYTACMAFGLERMAFTFITQVGMRNCLSILENYIDKKYERCEKF